jgi:hypothetical protein
VELFSPHPLFSVEFIAGIWFLSFVAASDTNNQQNHNMKPTRTIHINGWEINKYENYSKIRYVASYRNEVGEIVKDFSKSKLSVVKHCIEIMERHKSLA